MLFKQIAISALWFYKHYLFPISVPILFFLDFLCLFSSRFTSGGLIYASRSAFQNQ